MAGMSNALIDKLLNATTPTGTSGVPGTWTAYNGGAMKIKLTSSASSASASGTELTGTGYAAQAFSEAADAASGGGPVTMPKTTELTWTNGSGGPWSVVSFELIDGAGARTWFGNLTGQPVVIADGNSLTIAVDGISIDLS